MECLRAAGTDFEKLVNLGYDLPVVSLDIRYKQPLTLGAAAVVKTRLETGKSVRLNWHYEIETAAPSPQLCASAQVSLVTVSMRDRKIVRRLPAEIKLLIEQVEAHLKTAS